MYKTMKRLHLMWSNPVTKKDNKIGVLEKSVTGYEFSYFQDEIQKAYQYGFINLVAFPEVDRMYQSPRLFSVFERRIPSPNRREYKEAVGNFGSIHHDEYDWEYLRVTKGRLATDRLFFEDDSEQVMNRA